MVCSSIGQDLTIAIRPRSSVGLVAVVVSRSGKGAFVELREGPAHGGMTPLLPLPAALARHDESRLSTVGWGEPEELRRETIPTRGMLRVPVELSRGCARLDVVGGAPLAQFDAQLWRRDGVSLAAARGGEVATVYACTPSATKADLELVAIDRPGPVAVLHRHIDDVPAALMAAPRAASRLLGRFEGLGLGPVSPTSLEGLTAQPLEPGRRGEGKLTLEPGQCVDLVAAADGPPQSVSLRLEEGSIEHVRTSGHGVTALEHCSREGGHFRYRLEVTGAAADVLTAHRRR